MKTKRLYLDYNATSPLAISVVNYLSCGQFPCGNASATHTSGKEAKKIITTTKNIIYNSFQNISDYRIVFNSGATEGINTFFNFLDKTNDIMVYFISDHPAVHAMAKRNHSRGVEVLELPILTTGLPDIDSIIKTLSSFSKKNIFLNYTFVNNETGIVWPLENAEKIKKSVPCKIHIDAVQSVGKIHDWNKLSGFLDAYSFSGHKFGSLKSIGFSLYRQDLVIQPLVVGGGQQSNFRSGTENPLSVHCVGLALAETLNNNSVVETQQFRAKIEDLFRTILIDDGFIIAFDQDRAANTICLCLKNIRGDMAQIKFDMQDVDVSFGSACSSSSVQPSNSMIGMGISQYASNIIRISIGPEDYLREEDILNKLTTIFISLKNV